MGLSDKERANKVRCLMTEAALHIDNLRKAGYEVTAHFADKGSGAVIYFTAKRQVEETL